MEKTFVSGLRRFGSLLAAFAPLLLIGCAGVSSNSNASQQHVSGQLALSPSSMRFGNVAVGNNGSQTGTLTANGSAVTVSSAAWNGGGYSVNGIKFPVTIAEGQSASFTVTFAPQTAGASSGSVAFDSNASNSPSTEALSGTGTQASQDSVPLSWDASASQVVGYNLYRGTTSGGPYAKLTSSLLSSTNYTDSSVQSGTAYYNDLLPTTSYVATATDSSNVESTYSNQATAVIPNR